MSDGARFSLTLPGLEQRCEIAVEVGLMRDLHGLLAEHAPAHRYAIISDATVARLHGETLATTLREAGLDVLILPFPAGESSKSPAEWARLVGAMAEAGLGRDAAVLALGGGVTGDLAGFVAASYARGIPLVQLPTTLLAMVDSAIGGKAGLDLEQGKNLVGAFHQPRLVVADPAVLETLPVDALRWGAAEAVKHGVIADAAYLDWLEEAAADVLEKRPAALNTLITGSVRVKTRYVVEDALEGGARAMLNLGHTVGHAVEHVTGYAVPHGEAVAMGLVAEARIGEAAGVTEAGTADRVRRTLTAFGLPGDLPAGLDRDALLAAARLDKKAREGEARYALVRRIGEPARGADGSWTHALPDALARGAIGGL